MSSCVSPRCTYETLDCEIVAVYAGGFGETLGIIQAWDFVDPDQANIRVPISGNLPIVKIEGNAVCTNECGPCERETGKNCILPCRLGPGASVMGGLPGLPDQGAIRFRDNEYVIRSFDPTTLSIHANVEVKDNCDVLDSLDCAGPSNIVQLSTETSFPICDDGNKCTMDFCSNGVCSNTVIGLESDCASKIVYLYVDATAKGPIHDGLSWCHAYLRLQDAIDVARVAGNGIAAIRIAQGMYTPALPDGDRFASFQLLSGVPIIGGFAGCSSAKPDEWNPSLFPTTLSGDLNGDDAYCSIATNDCDSVYDDNVQHVVSADHVLGSFHGLLAKYFESENLTGPPIVRIDPTVDFFWGSGAPDGIIDPDTYSARWEGIVSPPASGLWKFTVHVDDGVRLWINDVKVIDEWQPQPPTLHNSQEIPLAAGQSYSLRMEYYELGGGAVARLLWSGPQAPLQVIPQEYLSVPANLKGVTIRDGRTVGCGCDSGRCGGGLLVNGGSPRIETCRFVENVAEDAGGAAAVINRGSASFVDCSFERNRSGIHGGAMVLFDSAMTMSNCRITDNASQSGGGIASFYTSCTMEMCTFLRNRSFFGGGAFHAASSVASFSNCLLAENNSDYKEDYGGGAMYGRDNSAIIISNCTVAANSASFEGGGIRIDPDSASLSSIEVSNSIFWDNLDRNGFGTDAQIHTPPTANTRVSYSCIEDETASDGEVPFDGLEMHNIDENPVFTDCYESWNYCLHRSSPCTDRGSNALVPFGSQVDLSGKPRIAGSSSPLVVDMGAFELQPDCEAGNGTAETVCSRWIGDVGRWSDPPDGSWCPPRSPENTALQAFEVLILEPRLVSLNTSPTINSLFLGPGSTLRADSTSAAIQALSVVLPLTTRKACGLVPSDEPVAGLINQGTLLATDGRRLVVDAPFVDQSVMVSGSGGGVLAAVGKGSILQVTGARVLGGYAYTESGGRIYLVGGAELKDVEILGVVVPNGQSAAFRGHIENMGELFVAGETSPTNLAPAEPNPADAKLEGFGSVRLLRRPFSKLGDAKGAFTNGSQHRIEGAGIVLGGLVNDGTIRADTPGDELVISAPGRKVNNSMMEAVDSGTLRIADDVEGHGHLRAHGGAIRILLSDDSVSVVAADLDICAGSTATNGLLSITGDTQLMIEGMATIGPRGAIRADRAIAGVNNGSVSAADLVINGGDSGLLDKPGGVALTDQMSLEGRHLLMIGDKGGSHPPPAMRTYDASRCQVTGDTVIEYDCDVTYRSSEPFTLGGDFENKSRDPFRFDWLHGAMKLNGSNLQTYEVAGINVDASPDGFLVGTSVNCDGAHTNFSVGTLELTGESLVRFENIHDNTSNPANPDDQTEALYVENLVIQNGAHFEIAENTFVYYVNLEGSIETACQAGRDQIIAIPCAGRPENCIPVLPDCPLCQCLDGPDVIAKPQCRVHDRDADSDVDMNDVALEWTP